MPEIDRIKEKAIDASLMGIGAMLPVYSKVARVVSSAASSTPGKAVTGVIKVGAAFAEPIVRTFVDSLTGADEAPARSEPGVSGEPAPGARDTGGPVGTPRPVRAKSAGDGSASSSESASSSSTRSAPKKTRSSGGSKQTSAKKTAAGKTSSKSGAKKPSAKNTSAKNTVGRSSGGTTAGASRVAPAPIDLPLPTYPSLSLSAAMDALNGLTVEQLQQVREYEVAHEDRLPILDRIDQLVASVQ